MGQTHFRRALMFGALACVTGGSGCASMNNTEKGAAVGGGVGAVAGTAIGAATHHPLLGAAVGGLTGAVVGGAVGNDVDKQEQRNKDVAQAAALADAQAQQQQQRIGMFDVIRMAQEGQDDTVIINQIRNTRSTFDLSASDLSELKRAGVSARVIAEMQAARPAARPTRVIVRDPAPVVYEDPYYVRPAPVVVVGPRPYPYYGGGYYYRRGW